MPTPTACRSTSSAGDEVDGSCTQLREYLEHRGQAYVLRVASSFTLALAAGTTLTCADAVKKLLKNKKAWEVRYAGRGSKGRRWYAWAWLGTASARHSLLVRRLLKTGDLAFDAGLRPGPFPDQAASLLPGSLAATRTGLPPAGDDELLIRS